MPDGFGIPDRRPDWYKEYTDPQHVSVLDSGVEKAVKWLLGMLSDPNNQTTGLMAPLAPTGQATTGPIGSAVKAAMARLWHGSPSELAELYPGSMLTNQPTWAAGYTTRAAGGIGPEMFTGRLHGVDVNISDRVITAPTLHGAEGRLLELAREALGRPAKTLREAAEAVRQRFGYEAIVAKDRAGNITGAIPLAPSKVSETMDPATAVREALDRGESVPDNLRDALSRVAVGQR